MGGAVFSLFGQVTVSDSTLSGNSAAGGAGGAGEPGLGGDGAGMGGAVFDVDGPVSLSGSTIAANSATGGEWGPAGGGVYGLAFGNTITSGSATTATVTLAGSIVYANTGAGGAENDLELDQISGNAANTSTSALTSTSIIGATSTTGGATATGSPVTSNPMLGPLQNNGGQLETMKPGREPGVRSWQRVRSDRRAWHATPDSDV
jgi:hypothetical protein